MPGGSSRHVSTASAARLRWRGRIRITHACLVLMHCVRGAVTRPMIRTISTAPIKVRADTAAMAVRYSLAVRPPYCLLARAARRGHGCQKASGAAAVNAAHRSAHAAHGEDDSEREPALPPSCVRRGARNTQGCRSAACRARKYWRRRNWSSTCHMVATFWTRAIAAAKEARGKRGLSGDVHIVGRH